MLRLSLLLILTFIAHFMSKLLSQKALYLAIGRPIVCLKAFVAT